jgi:uncharacterized membrane protein
MGGIGRTTAGTANSITAPGLILGIGFGGVFDGIVLHQILQWHHMLSSQGCCPLQTVHGLELNTIGDGLFHLATIVLLLIGTTVLWRRVHEDGVPWSGRQLLGLGLEGWGLFNLIEGVLDHQILGVHHVRAGPHQLAYDMGFLALGAGLVVVGYLLARAGSVCAPSDEGTSRRCGDSRSW